MTVKNGYYKEKKPLKRIKEHCRNFTAFLFSNVGIIILVVFYTIGGAFMFREIEVSQSEHTMKHFGERNVKKIAKRLWTETVINVLNEKDFKTRINATLTDFQTTLFKSHLAGVGVNITQQWSFSGAFLYSLTVITTIGYGNISPKSIWGKLVTILYAIIGMPLFLLYLSNIGDILAKSFKWIYAKVFLCRICPGVTKRRIMREHLKIKAMALELMDLDDYSIDEELNLEMENLDIQKDSSTVTVPITVSLTIIIG
ncbi:KCNK18.2 family protein [Megaselia abdita]